MFSCFSYPACKLKVPYIIVICGCPLLYNIFPYYFIKSTNLWNKTVENKMCVLIFSTPLSETLVILRRIQRDIIINIHISAWKLPCSFQILMEFKSAQQIFEKSSNIQFREKLSSGITTLTVQSKHNILNNVKLPHISITSNHHQVDISCSYIRWAKSKYTVYSIPYTYCWHTLYNLRKYVS